MKPKLCKRIIHRWGDDLYFIPATVRLSDESPFTGEVALLFCRDCNAVKYSHVSMSRPISAPEGTTDV